MNIKELIAELQGYQENVSNAMIPIYETPEVCKKAAKALLAQQIVIEQMREALESFDGLLDYTGNAEKRRRTALALQPSLDALREHDAAICEKVYHAVRGASLSLDGVALTATQVLSICAQLTAPICAVAERRRKGE